MRVSKDHPVPLRCWSGYSLLRGPVAVGRLVERAAGLGVGALALTDVNNLYGATVFHKQATAAGLRPIIGAELRDGPWNVTALVADEAAYENLCRILTRIALRNNPYDGENAARASRPPFPAGDGRSAAIDRIWRSLGSGGTVASPVTAGGTGFPTCASRGTAETAVLHDLAELSGGLVFIAEDSRLAAAALAAGLPANQLYLGIDPATQPLALQRRLAECSQSTGLPLVAAAPAMLLDDDDHDLARLLAAIRLGSTLDAVGNDQLPHRRAKLRSPEQLAYELADFPQAMANNRRLAERCQFALLPRRPVFPKYDCPPGLSAAVHLEALCRAGISRRYGSSPPPVAEARLRRELDMIVARGFAEYFLVVREIVQYAREKGLPVAGRGSGAGSLAAYLLGITNVCPLAFNVPFERFLNERRTDFPDLDIDFCWRFRDEVIAFAFRRWGAANVAMVSMHLTFQPRSAIRETAKALGLSNDQISQLERGQRDGELTLPDRYEGLLERDGRKAPPTFSGGTACLQAVEDNTGCEQPVRPNSRNTASPRRAVPPKNDDPLLRIALFSRRLLGLPHNLSVHPGGIVIGKKPIDHYVPVQPAAKGVMITQYDKDGVEDIGLVKLDLLGNRNLSTVRYASELISQRHGVRLDCEALPREDAATAGLLGRADTVGCNQLESPAMRHLLLQMRAKTARDVMAVLAMIRPGAASIGMKEVFVRRLQGLEAVPAGFAPVDEILRETFGVMLYEDDVMLTAAAVAGCSLAEADRFRKAVQKCPDDNARLALSREFLDACRARGMDMDYAKSIWVQMAKFNAYSFCRAHAASYGQLAYAGAYIKAHYPLEFWAGCLNNNQSMYHPRVYVEQAKRAGIGFLLPDANRSQLEFSLEGPAIRLGLNRITGLGPVAVEGILQARGRGEFASLSDFLARTHLGYNETRNMVLCGAFDFTGLTRPQLMMELELSRAGVLPESAFGGTGFPTCASSGMGILPMSPAGILPAPSGGTGCSQPLSSVVPHGFQPLLLSSRPNLPELPGDYSPLRKYMDQRRITGLSVGEHIMALHRPALAGQVNADSRDLPARLGRRVRIAGVLEAQRVTTTSSGKDMAFLTLDDEWGLFEVTVFPGACPSQALQSYGPHIVSGLVQDNYGAIILEAHKITTPNLKTATTKKE